MYNQASCPDYLFINAKADKMDRCQDLSLSKCQNHDRASPKVQFMWGVLVLLWPYQSKVVQVNWQGHSSVGTFEFLIKDFSLQKFQRSILGMIHS